MKLSIRQYLMHLPDPTMSRVSRRSVVDPEGLLNGRTGYPFSVVDHQAGVCRAGSSRFDRSTLCHHLDNRSVRLPHRCQSLQENHRHD